MTSKDTWLCTKCKELYSVDEETDDEENKDYAEQFFCDECDPVKEKPYCGDCSLLFEQANVVICQDCLDTAMKECPNMTGKVIEKVIEKPVYIKENGTSAEETMEDFEKRITRQ